MKTIYGLHGEVLLRAGIELSNNYINKLKGIGLNGVYIHDDISKDIEVKSLINESLKNQAVKDMKDSFVFAEKGSYSKAESIKAFNRISETVSSFIDEISKNDNLIINMIDLKVFDDYTFYHSVNVALLAIVLGMSLNLSKKNIHDLGIAAIMHDIGKVFIPIEILNKDGKLEQNEWNIIKKHSRNGYTYLRDKYPIPYKCYEGVLHHHERWDGTGYPLELKANQISLFGRIIAIADVYDALISDRPYRKGFAPYEALEYILAGGDSMFDMNLVEQFTKKIQPYPVGSIVTLSNGFTAIVVENFEGRGTRPVVRVFKDENKEIEPFILDLWDKSTRSITVTGIIEDY
jgi:HD-GYP domain-containing protein (c-di-GMP phosphodiesterase class II)